MKNIKHIIAVVFTFIIGLINAQDINIEKISKNYDYLAYVTTSEILLKVAEKGYESSELFQKLGNSFYFNNKMEDAVKWYEKLMNLEHQNPLDPEYYFRYAQALKGIEDYKKSDKWMKKFKEANPLDFRSIAFDENKDYLSRIEERSYKNVIIKNLEINSKLSDFGTTPYSDQIIFASSRGKSGMIYKWNNQPYLDLYSATKQDDGAYGLVEKFDDKINTKFHESSVTFTPNAKFIYFTRNNYFKKRYRKDDKDFNRLQLFRAELGENGTWGNISRIHFNNDSYSVAHPTINADGSKLYFASDMPGSIGMSDIYVVYINEDGTLGTPENLGVNINTEGVESFPFINKKGDLYFSSTGYPGLGGLDIYVIKDFEQLRNKKTNTYNIINIGKPFNSFSDDFAYYENLKKHTGFFSSNREGGKGDDDIYSFTIGDCKQELAGIVKDFKTQDLLVNATVTLFDALGNVIETKKTGADASFSFQADCNDVYLIRAEKEDYSTDEKRIEAINSIDNLNLKLLLKRDKQKVKLGDDLAKTLDIPIIYFDLDKSNIRPDAALELQKIIQVMKEHPEMNIEVRSHTDSRANDAYNDALSERRNKATIKYLVAIGKIKASRLRGKGYGEKRLVNRCSNGVKCTEAEHQKNRRSEFIVF
ncbi:OmpA family protein [Algibacter pacificus]|uniref:OmpA family protein n=1 Tax=Algibacter pacificus TaxID=2599389 RepID=UPI0011CA76F6|nr:OmpA family protein [Algibacter pacificus]